MPAIVTDILKRQIARDFFDQFTNQTANYYIGIGRSEQWDSSDTVPTPVNTPAEIEKLQFGLQGVKKVTGTSLVVPRNNWSNGQIYSQYDDLQVGYPSNPYYVKTDNNQVYICLETGRDDNGIANPSTVEPTGSNNDSFRTSDGYVWKFLYTISAQNANDFMSSNFQPVQRQATTDSNSSGIQLKQEEVQNAAIGGQILSIIVTDNGAGYTANPTVTIGGTGSGARANAFIDSATGTLAKIQMSDSGTTLVHGSGYTRTLVTLSGGGATTQATARAVLGPDSGIGRDARIDLKASGIMFFTKLEGTDSDLIVDQDFRQVSLIKNPKTPVGSLFTDTTGNALYRMELSNIITSFTKDKIIQGQTTLAKAYVDEIDSNAIYYHQTAFTGFLAFQDGEVVEETNGAGEGIIDSAKLDPEVDPVSGDILYIDNRAPVLRSSPQAEDIKVIIQF